MFSPPYSNGLNHLNLDQKFKPVQRNSVRRPSVLPFVNNPSTILVPCRVLVLFGKPRLIFSLKSLESILVFLTNAGLSFRASGLLPKDFLIRRILHWQSVLKMVVAKLCDRRWTRNRPSSTRYLLGASSFLLFSLLTPCHFSPKWI